MSNYFFHPYELAICGYSGSGKTTLLEKILSELATKFKVGLAKHDAHYFTFDYPGKDTYRLRAAGAFAVSIQNQTETAFIGTNGSKAYEAQKLKACFSECDFVLVEGHKFSPIPKIVILDSEGAIAKDLQEKRVHAVVAYIYTEKETVAKELLSLALPCFHRDDYQAITAFILAWLRLKAH
ncbi:MAG: molybdopterin-guanine dinucleotide biosynthesis protein B [Oligoflexia bacterium]|nr:molybdopterin-guanine dinucleotide biosynthesis protein B [Oligoflexia bacterium]MBF0366896.1 molybdopterin-guanine dinucleotide biosynthesis protein B [Oligoflexia bacterium]